MVQKLTNLWLELRRDKSARINALFCILGVSGLIGAVALLWHPAWRVTPEMVRSREEAAERSAAIVERCRQLQPFAAAGWTDLEGLAEALLFTRPQGGRLASFLISGAEGGAEIKLVVLNESDQGPVEFARSYGTDIERALAGALAVPASVQLRIEDDVQAEDASAHGMTLRGTVRGLK